MRLLALAAAGALLLAGGTLSRAGSAHTQTLKVASGPTWLLSAHGFALRRSGLYRELVPLQATGSTPTPTNTATTSQATPTATAEASPTPTATTGPSFPDAQT